MSIIDELPGVDAAKAAADGAAKAIEDTKEAVDGVISSAACAAELTAKGVAEAASKAAKSVSLFFEDVTTDDILQKSEAKTPGEFSLSWLGAEDVDEFEPEVVELGEDILSRLRCGERHATIDLVPKGSNMSPGSLHQYLYEHAVDYGFVLRLAPDFAGKCAGYPIVQPWVAYSLTDNSATSLTGR